MERMAATPAKEQIGLSVKTIAWLLVRTGYGD